jgi:hypothetical protein
MRIFTTLRDDTQHNSAECRYALCCYVDFGIFNVMLRVTRLNVIIPSAIKSSFMALSKKLAYLLQRFAVQVHLHV